jgi:hypothetical protein
MERIRHRETAYRGIELLFERALAGSAVACEQLARFAREILHEAGDVESVPIAMEKPTKAREIRR